MPRSAFRADVRDLSAEAGKADLKCVEDISYDTKNDVVHVSFKCGDRDTPVAVQILCGDLDLYPDSRHYFISTWDSSQSHAWVVDNVQQIIQDLDERQTLWEVIRQLIKAFESLGTTNQICIDSDDSDDSDEEETAFDVEVEDKPDSFPTSVLGTKRRRPGHTHTADDPANFRLAVRSQPSNLRPDTIPADQRVARFESLSGARKARIQEDLKAVSDAGYFFGVLEGMTGMEDNSILAVSVKISTLALSLQMLLAWDLHPDMYFVLLIRFSRGYFTYEPLLELSDIEAGTAFRVGKCTKYKPSVREAFAAFGLDSSLSTVGTEAGSEDETAHFSKILISSELGKLMSDSFLAIVKFYNLYGSTWADASKSVVSQPSIQSYKQRTDSTSMSRGSKSLPLLAMQFAVDRLRNCTKYCQSCYTELDKNWQSLKPTVCSRELCLYQHIQIGLTQYLEYEILCQPAVIDLLINFCYVALTSFIMTPHVQPAIRAFPSGLRFFVPDLDDSHTGYFSRTDEKRFTIVLSKKDSAHSAYQFRKKHWVAISNVRKPTLGAGQILRHAVITDVDSTGSILYLKSDTGMAGYPAACYIFPYTKNIDTVSDYHKACLLKDILDTLPSVDFIKSQLESPLVGNLKHVEGISPSAVVLLEWIIATNRSCIMQITNKNLMVLEKMGLNYSPPTMWLQFCFFHGPPNAEAQFESELASCLAAGKIENPTCPTLLAWHGSKIQNWHSILRTGLDYQEIVNGRSFGNGVYFSPDFATSHGYTGQSTYPQWPKAVTDLDSVMSLNEIINAPRYFKSANPHYVVHEKNWSRCRFLFAKAKSSVPHRWPQIQNTALSISASTDCGYFMEDSQRQARGPHRGTLQIPLASMPPRTMIAKANDSSTALHMNLLQKGGQAFMCTMDAKDLAFTQAVKSPLEVYVIDDDCADESDAPENNEDNDVDDKDVVITKVVPRTYIEISDDEDDTLKPPFKKAKTAAAEPKHVHVNDNVTPFVAGKLNHGTLQVLQPPSWGTPSAQRALVSSMRDAQRMQASTPLPNLGWYIDFDKLENLFQWVFELHSFDNSIPLAADMRANNVNSIVMEMRFGPDYPITPPLVRVIRPRFLPFMQGGGGHITAGGSVCMELLTGTGWLPSYELSSVLMQVHLALSTAEPPARLEARGTLGQRDYGITEAMAGYMRAAATHGWSVPRDMAMRGIY
ncbi:ubiquitin conjugating enzyme [Ophiostoma piceae UAMH 11346]|uniref:Ubiquitin conjugating enzyme n=1 Tax=Ophiostoma piceae (strain UAMH 11346) TaxID=1262450 RepID=S3CIR5_OPHP1|nr:ubiquitin conjugating enzyme [Ophiostoma piceae UAMH 11346]